MNRPATSSRMPLAAPANSRWATLRAWAGKDIVWLAALLIGGAIFWSVGGLAAEEGVRIPPPREDIATTSAAAPAAIPGGPAATSPAAISPSHQTAVFAGGCFWGVQAVFQHTRGVVQAVSGYAGGSAQTARYELITTGTTGHAESVQVTFDPSVISYGQLLQIFFSVAHDPTQLNRQGPDSGTHYRSALFTMDDAQRRIAAAYIAQLDAAKVYRAPIVTELTPLQAFYSAEAYHQDYATNFPDQPYIIAFDKPKIEALKKLFGDRFRAEPQLVNGPLVPRRAQGAS